MAAIAPRPLWRSTLRNRRAPITTKLPPSFFHNHSSPPDRTSHTKTSCVYQHAARARAMVGPSVRRVWRGARVCASSRLSALYGGAGNGILWASGSFASHLGAVVVAPGTAFSFVRYTRCNRGHSPARIRNPRSSTTTPLLTFPLHMRVLSTSVDTPHRSGGAWDVSFVESGGVSVYALRVDSARHPKEVRAGKRVPAAAQHLLSTSCQRRLTHIAR